MAVVVSSWPSPRREPPAAAGDSYDNALAETVNGLHKAELIHPHRAWPSLEAVELATMNWVYGRLVELRSPPPGPRLPHSGRDRSHLQPPARRSARCVLAMERNVERFRVVEWRHSKGAQANL